MMQKCKELRSFAQTTLHSWPREMEPWSRVHIDHTHITGGGFLLILVDSFSGWPQVIRVQNKKSSTIKQILRVIFSRNGTPQTLEFDNAPEFWVEDLNLWLEKIGCKPYKTPSIEWVGGRNGADRKNGTEIIFSAKWRLLSYRTISYA